MKTNRKHFGKNRIFYVLLGIVIASVVITSAFYVLQAVEEKNDIFGTLTALEKSIEKEAKDGTIENNPQFILQSRIQAPVADGKIKIAGLISHAPTENPFSAIGMFHFITIEDGALTDSAEVSFYYDKNLVVGSSRTSKSITLCPESGLSLGNDGVALTLYDKDRIKVYQFNSYVFANGVKGYSEQVGTPQFSYVVVFRVPTGVTVTNLFNS